MTTACPVTPWSVNSNASSTWTVESNELPTTNYVTAIISAQNTFSDALRLCGNFNVSIQGTFVATIVLQRSYDNVTWYNLESFTAPVEQIGAEPEFIWYRLGIKTGGYTSGTVSVRISQCDCPC